MNTTPILVCITFLFILAIPISLAEFGTIETFEVNKTIDFSQRFTEGGNAVTNNGNLTIWVYFNNWTLNFSALFNHIIGGEWNYTTLYQEPLNQTHCFINGTTSSNNNGSISCDFQVVYASASTGITNVFKSGSIIAIILGAVGIMFFFGYLMNNLDKDHVGASYLFFFMSLLVMIALSWLMSLGATELNLNDNIQTILKVNYEIVSWAMVFILFITLMNFTFVTIGKIAKNKKSDLDRFNQLPSHSLLK